MMTPHKKIWIKFPTEIIPESKREQDNKANKDIYESFFLLNLRKISKIIMYAITKIK